MPTGSRPAPVGGINSLPFKQVSSIRAPNRRSKLTTVQTSIEPTGSKAYGLPSDSECEGGLPRPPRTPPAASASVLHRPVFARWRCSPLGLCSALPALVRRGFATRGATIANRSVSRVPALDQRNTVKPFRAAARFITFAAPYPRPVGAWGGWGRLAGPPRQPASASRPLSGFATLARALPPRLRRGATHSLAPYWRAPLATLGATRATSGTLDYPRGVRGF